MRLPGKGNSKSHGARPVHLVITMIKWMRASRLSIKNCLSQVASQTKNNYVTEICSGSEAGSYLRLIDFVYHSTLGLRVIKKKKKAPTSSSIRTSEREFFIDNLLIRIHFIIVMIRWTGLAPWDFGFPFPGSLTSTFLATQVPSAQVAANAPSKSRE